MKELYEAVLSEAKKAVSKDKETQPGAVGFHEETHILIKEAIELYRCINTQTAPGSSD